MLSQGVRWAMGIILRVHFEGMKVWQCESMAVSIACSLCVGALFCVDSTECSASSDEVDSTPCSEVGFSDGFVNIQFLTCREKR